MILKDHRLPYIIDDIDFTELTDAHKIWYFMELVNYIPLDDINEDLKKFVRENTEIDV